MYLKARLMCNQMWCRIVLELTGPVMIDFVQRLVFNPLPVSAVKFSENRVEGLGYAGLSVALR